MSGGLAGVLTVAALVLVPAAPAAAVQSMSWTQSLPATAIVGSQVSLAISGTANTFLGARITGCFVTFPDGNNYTNSFGGNFTTGTCSYTNRTLPTVGPYAITIGFTLSTGSPMSLSSTVNVQAPTPTLTVPGELTVEATNVDGAAVGFEASAWDTYFGSTSPTCTPASGATFPVGTTTVNCRAENAGGQIGYADFPVTVTKTDPTLLWSPPASVTYGTSYGELLTAAMEAADATGTISYARADGTPFAPNDVIPVGVEQVLMATYVPSGAAAAAYTVVTEQRTITVERAMSAVSFGGTSPSTKKYGDAPFAVEASGTVGAGTVTVGAQAGSDCTVTSPETGTSVDATVTLTGAGSCILLADQAETVTHLAAPTAQWSVTVAKANPQITWTPPRALIFGHPVSDLRGATADVPGTFTYLIDGNVVAPGTVLDVGGDRVVSVAFAPDNLSNYVEAVADHEFSITVAEQVLTVGAIDEQAYGADPFDLDISGSGSGTVSATAAGSCAVSNLKVTLVAVGHCTITVSKAATNNYLAAVPVTRTFEVEPGAQTLTVGAISDKKSGTAPFTLAIGETGPGAVTAAATGSCTVAGMKVTVGTSGKCTVTVRKAATATYAAAVPVTRAFSVIPLAPTISRVSPAVGPTAGKKSVTITGTGFTGVTSVKFGTAAAVFTLKNSTSIVATAPAAKVGTYDIRVTTAGGTSVLAASARYVVRPVPKITKLSATSGPKAGKKSITVRGIGFTGATVVTFGTVTVAVTVKNDTTIVVKSPKQKVGTYDVRVTTPGGISPKAKADRYKVNK